MDVQEFQRILTAFADSPADIDLTKGDLLVQVHGETVVAKVTQEQGTLYVVEEGNRSLANSWIVNRIARIPQLVDRILSYVPESETFVHPCGILDDQGSPEHDGDDNVAEDALVKIGEFLDRRPAGTSSVLYLTSGAGEGKTTLINHFARTQAEKYKAKKTSWLVIPISLGGRTFLRFDDVIIGALVNRFRFQFFYYDAFIELVRLGVLVPAFDGFEEVFVESNYGEALSALGDLVSMLGSSGSMLVAARSAYFDYKNFSSQARMFDAIRSESVVFSKMTLQRWSKEQFIDYALKRNVANAEVVYERVGERLKTDHPILTRAVLVKRLLDIAVEIPDVDSLLDSLGHRPHDYFSQFVNAIIEREVQDKWIDKSGEAAKSLLSLEQHHGLLSLLAQEMWILSSEILRDDILDLVTDIFVESEKLTLEVSRQVKERIKNHSLLATADVGKRYYQFDHEDFRKFFLGEALGEAIINKSGREVKAMLQIGALPSDALDSAAFLIHRSVEKNGVERVSDWVGYLLSIGASDLPASFTRENCGGLVIRLVDKFPQNDLLISHAVIPADGLIGRDLSGISFVGCHFHDTGLQGARISHCKFDSCRFSHLTIADNTEVDGSQMCNSTIDSVLDVVNEMRLFDPTLISRFLKVIGFEILSQEAESFIEPDSDERFYVLEKMLRMFLRNTQIYDDSIRRKLGKNAPLFYSDVLPVLKDEGVVSEVSYSGSGKQKRYKLNLQMRELESIIMSSRGEFDSIIDALKARAR